jgi:hypothetical protein
MNPCQMDDSGWNETAISSGKEEKTPRRSLYSQKTSTKYVELLVCQKGAPKIRCFSALWQVSSDRRPESLSRKILWLNNILKSIYLSVSKDLQPFVESSPLFQILDLLHNP